MSDKTEHPPIPDAFAALGVRPSILQALAKAKFVTPSEIQDLLIPRALAGVDILGQARTGTGKTAAFGIPILQRAAKGVPFQAIILVPTRELAVQVDDEIKRLAEFTPIRSVAVYGGQKIMAQMKFLKHNPEVLVGTPGRVMDLLERNIIHFRNIRFVVLDEVDRMLDIGFRDDIRRILSQVKGVSKRSGFAPEQGSAFGNRSNRGFDQNTNANPAMPVEDIADDDQPIESDPHHTTVEPFTGHQTMFVSATISDEIEKLARRYMREPVEKLIAPGANDRPTVEKVEQWYFSVQPWDKYRLLRMLLERENPELAIVFCRTKHSCEKVAAKLMADGIECREIHGNLIQTKRDRVMKSFRSGKFDVLVATDLASRGIDVADISHIINYDIPDDPEAYVHRIGRTARMGATGKAFTFVAREQGAELTKVESLINMVIQQATIEGWEPRPEPGGFGGPPMSAPRAPIPSRFATPTPTTPAVTADFDRLAGPGTAPVPLPPRPLTIGSKIPITRRHKRRR